VLGGCFILLIIIHIDLLNILESETADIGFFNQRIICCKYFF
jgi:hypothetical protein